ncbi:MAG: cysteine desulfurase family protein [Lysinibacillus sp.]
MKAIYLDHAATTPVNEQVLATILEAQQQVFGNPSSIHGAGREARKFLDEARKTLATSIGATPNEIIFTSGGTEADNMAIFGTAYARQSEGKHIITTQIEHHAVLHACEKLEKEGFDITYLPVDTYGCVSVEAVRDALRDDTILVTIMYGNNEVGALQPIEEIGALLKQHPATFHTDAVQAFGMEALHVQALGVDLLSVSSHKINGPKGIGFLYAKQGVKLSQLLVGGSQEKKRRAGTENVASAIGFAKAAEIAEKARDEKRQQFISFKHALIARLTEASIDFTVNGHVDNALPHVLNISFTGTDVESFLVNLDMVGVYVSSGSACTAGSIDPSHVLVAMYGENTPQLRNSIRFSFGQGITHELLLEAADRVIAIVKRLVK